MQFIHFEHVFNSWRVSLGGESSLQGHLVELSIKNSLPFIYIASGAGSGSVMLK